MVTRRTGQTAPILFLIALMAFGLEVGPEAVSRRPGEPGPSAPQFNRRDPAGTVSEGKFLVADRTLGDPNFFETVVLLFSYSPAGAGGLIINRRTELPPERILPDLPKAKGPPPVIFFGGPVAVTGVRALLRSPTTRTDGHRLLNDLYLLNTVEALKNAMTDGAGSDRIRLYLGYAGWGAGQLEREIRAGAWHVFDGQAALVFDPNPDAVWLREIRLTEVLSV